MVKNREYLKGQFETNDIPTGEDFADLLDSVLIKGEDGIEQQISNVNALLGNKVDKVTGKGLSTNDYTSTDKNNLSALWSALASGGAVNTVTWGGSTNANDMTTSGTYRLKGERTNGADNLPIANTGSGHTIDAMLYVLDASLTNGTGETDDVTITQLLVLSNRVGGQQGGMWMRSAYGRDKNSLTWKQWEKMQTNMEVGIVSDDYQYNTQGQQIGSTYAMNYLVDNGIYSGVYVPSGATLTDVSVETFVMVCINNYAYSTVQGWYPELTQIRMGITGGGDFIMQRRTAGKSTEPGAKWGFAQWVDLTKDSRIGEGASIGKNAHIEEHVLIGKHTQFEPGIMSEKYHMGVLDSPHLESTIGFRTEIGKNTNIGEGVTIPANTKIKDTSIDNFDDLWVAAGGAIDATNTEAPYKIKALKNIEEANISLTYKEALATYQHRIMWPYMPTIDSVPNLRITMVGTTGVFGCVDALPDMKKKVRSSYIEILYLGERNAAYPIKPSNCNGLLGNCPKLRMVIGTIDLSADNNSSQNIFNYGLSNLQNLTYIQLKNLKTGLLMERVPNISYDSMEYLVTNAANTSAITIKVHADVYAKLTGDTTNAAAADLSPEELAKWTALWTTAYNKSISFGV